MRLTDLFVKRPVLAIVVNLIILIAGLQSIRALSVRQYPRSDIAVVACSPVPNANEAGMIRCAGLMVWAVACAVLSASDLVR